MLVFLYLKIFAYLLFHLYLYISYLIDFSLNAVEEGFQILLL